MSLRILQGSYNHLVWHPLIHIPAHSQSFQDIHFHQDIEYQVGII